MCYGSILTYQVMGTNLCFGFGKSSQSLLATVLSRVVNDNIVRLSQTEITGICTFFRNGIENKLRGIRPGNNYFFSTINCFFIILYNTTGYWFFSA